MSKNIIEFTRGQKIKRIERSKPYSSGTRDGSYMGEEFIFMGVKDGQILLKGYSAFGHNRIIKLGLQHWIDGWEEVNQKEEMVVVPQNSIIEIINDNSELIDQIISLINILNSSHKYNFDNKVNEANNIFKKVKEKYNL